MKQASLEEARKELYNVVSTNIYSSVYTVFHNFFIFSTFRMVIFLKKHMIYTLNLMVLLMIWS